MSTITVLGGRRGFIGIHLVRRLEALGLDHEVPGRDEDLRGRNLGVVIDCTGVTFDFRVRPLAVEAHVCLVRRLLRESRLRSLTYLSSTRVYQGGNNPAREDDQIHLAPVWPEHLYNISKAMGESVPLAGHPGGRVVRLAHVYGADLLSENFLSAVLREVAATGEVTLRTALESSRDYVSVHDVVGCVIDIATRGRERVYNVGSGRSVSNREIASRLTDLGCRVSVETGHPATPSRFPTSGACARSSVSRPPAFSRIFPSSCASTVRPRPTLRHCSVSQMIQTLISRATVTHHQSRVRAPSVRETLGPS